MVRPSTKLFAVLAACAACTAGWIWLMGLGAGLAAGIILLASVMAILAAMKFSQFVKRLPLLRIKTRHLIRFVPRKKLAILSLAMTFLVGGMWRYSHTTVNTLTIRTSNQTFIQLVSQFGVLTAGHYYDSSLDLSEFVTWGSADGEVIRSHYEMMGDIFVAAGKGGNVISKFIEPFAWTNRTFAVRGKEIGSLSLSFPHWSLMVLLSLPLWICLAFGALRSRRNQENLCVTCGYNLTGNTSGTCPECGTSI